ncbi:MULTISPECIES: BREX-1 system adenine-specific DNA-methyltransferase PglX [Aeromonas]|nr:MULTISPECIES: BREX-1 system adenine-specific DNA-methyltransferase PglX [Aeromonas]
MSQQDNKEMAKYFYRASAADFKKIPGSPIAYWVADEVLGLFGHDVVGDYVYSQGSVKTGDNERFIRNHWEVSSPFIGFESKWRLHPRGGEYRKWYGNVLEVVAWDDNARNHYRKDFVARIPEENFWNLEGICWSEITSSETSFRVLEKDEIANNKSLTIYMHRPELKNYILAFLNSIVSKELLSFFNPTISFGVGDVNRLPFLLDKVLSDNIRCAVDELIGMSKRDWNEFEVSRGFLINPLLRIEGKYIKSNYIDRVNDWSVIVGRCRELEELINEILISKLGLGKLLNKHVLIDKITLKTNPAYRYSISSSQVDVNDRFQSDTIAELVSYAIGCMMGRYSLDREGLVYAHAGNVGFNDLVAEGAYQRFAADGDGILPLTSEHWFEDDIAARIEEFVRTVWGADTLEENLQFIADSLCLSAIKPPKKGGETSRETIRRYLSTQFFKDHLKTYKKRPIYWLFSSGKEKAFECLVYLHRYNEATLPRMRTEYVTPLLGQMASRIERLRLQQADASTAEAKRLDKQIDGLTKQLAELRAFDDQLKHHADMKITLDLDDGVKVNYGKFGTLLSDVKAITGDKGE